VSRWKKYYRCHCTECGKNCAAIPVGGDYLNAVYPAKHKGSDGETCGGTWMEIGPLLEPDDYSAKPADEEAGKEGV
jgi:hypothetical protein